LEDEYRTEELALVDNKYNTNHEYFVDGLDEAESVVNLTRDDKTTATVAGLLKLAVIGIAKETVSVKT
jgi:hypothetical protein